jgi:putative CocE/NonD family hydrolase
MIRGDSVDVGAFMRVLRRIAEEAPMVSNAARAFAATALLALAGPALAQTLLPPPFVPEHAVRIDKSVMVPMRDGVKLSTDLYVPEGLDGKLPVILMRTPYNKSNPAFWNFRSPQSVAYYFASHGYVVAVQDTRGKFESQGVYTVSADDSNDGFDTVAWLGAQSWSNGLVGTYGCSYLGENQLEMAKLEPPQLAAMLPQADGGSDRYFGMINGGAYEIASGTGWFRQHGAKYAPKVDAGLQRAEFVATVELFNFLPSMQGVDLPKLWRTLPTKDIEDRAGAAPNDWKDFLTHAPGDPWWDRFGYVKPQHRFNTPALQVNSWYDIAVGDTLALFNQLRVNADSAIARDNQFVIISPTAHCTSELASEHTIVGTRDLGDARFNYYDLYRRWFDHWLKGADNDVTRRPKVQIYVMGRNEWRGENEWPLARTVWTKYYLHSDGHANSRYGTGRLSTVPPTTEPADEFTYDPRSPVPTVGGAICCTHSADAEPGGFDQSEVEMRHDVLVYTSDPLPSGLEVTGPLKAVMAVSSSALDTDFTAKLVDVYPDGTAFNVQDGVLRVRYRQGYSTPTRMQPGAIYEITIDLQATSNVFGPGHRLRLEVSSSNFPRFDRNLNTGGGNTDEVASLVARNRVHHARQNASYILLPVIPERSGGMPINAGQ